MLFRVLAVLLALTLLLTGCSLHLSPPGGETTAATEASTQQTDPTDPTSIELPQDFDASEFPDAVDFNKITYTRPDTDAVCAAIDKVTAVVQSGADADTILDAIHTMEPTYNDFFTMDSVAYIHYCENLSDDYYKSEYDYLENQSPIVQKSMELLYNAAAKCDYKKTLEEEYFGENFLDFYLNHSIYTNETFVKLSQEESALQTEFMDAQDSPTIVVDGVEQDYKTLCDQYADDYNTLYTKVYPAYYAKYNQLYGEIYVKMVQLRKQMAAAIGYDSYQQFQYEYSYQRDYTPEMARQYISDLRDELSPLILRVQTASSTLGTMEYADMDIDEAKQALGESLFLMGHDFYKNYQFMQHFNLWDTSVSTSKMPGSYETYLYSYSEPFVYVSPEGTEADYLTIAHEFGHFCDSMTNDGEDNSIDKCEIFSQGLEFLSLFYNNLPKDTIDRMTKLKMIDALQVFYYQAMYADFEDRVYQYSGTLTLDAVNELYADTMRDYGMYYDSDGMEWYNRQSWIDITHFFVAPCYVISYCTSADAALQIYQLEAEKSGDGMTAYLALMDQADEKEFVSLLQDAGLESPFASGRAAEIKTLLQSLLFG
jgi:oligoendopeptidase F